MVPRTIILFLIWKSITAQIDIDSSNLRLARLETAKPRADNINYRLPGQVIPLHYELNLQPNFNNNNYTGSVLIKVRAVQDTNKIVMHKKLLDINPKLIKVYSAADQTKDMAVTNADSIGTKLQEFYEITCSNILKEKLEYWVEIPDFKGVLSETDRAGFYIAKYEDHDGNLRKLATTQFEPTSARRAFPCFDEPPLKATFNISVIRPKNYDTISNMVKLQQNSLDNGLVEDIFQTTPHMSTYLLAIIVSDFKLTDMYFRQRVLAKTSDVQQGKAEYALKTGEAVLNAMENFVGVKYALKKIDQAAIPDDYFTAGAMENWGLVTYKASRLLYKANESQDGEKQEVATIIGHEYAHQWFGDLVSPAWWRYLWLNEGFATYFQYRATSEVEPSMRLMDQFVIKNTQASFQQDALSTTRDMNMDAGSPSEIGALFDTIAYSKAGAVIRMMEAFITTPIFREGLKQYLQKREFQDATPADLYSSIQSALTALNPSLIHPNRIKDIMTSWDSNKGFPLVYIDRKYGTTDNNVIAGKVRYMLKNNTNGDIGTWIVPVNFVTQSNPNFERTTADFWIDQKESTLTVSGLQDGDWLIANKKQTGYYRVKYDDRNSQLIINAMKTNLKQIHLLNRAQIIDDFFNLARSGHIGYHTPLSLMSYLTNERDYIPLYAFFSAVSYLYNMLVYTPEYTDFQRETIKVLEGVYQYLGFDERITDKHTDKLNRANILTWMCSLEHTGCKTKALEKFRLWKSGDANAIPLNSQFQIYCGAMRGATQEDWNYLFDQYKREINKTARSRMFSALACSEKDTVLEKYFEKIVSDASEPTPYQILYSVAGGSSTGTKFTFNYIKSNFERILTILGESQMENLVNILASKLTTTAQLNELETLARSQNGRDGIFSKAIPKVKDNVAWNELNLKQFSDFFKTNSESNAITLFGSLFCVLLNIIIILLL